MTNKHKEHLTTFVSKVHFSRVYYITKKKGFSTRFLVVIFVLANAYVYNHSQTLSPTPTSTRPTQCLFRIVFVHETYLWHTLCLYSY